MANGIRAKSTGLACLLALMSACGGGGGGGGGDPPQKEPPSLTVDFPGAYSYVEASSVSSITVRGRAAAADPITGITVNGAVASSDDGFATWRVSVPLKDAEGPNTLKVSLDIENKADAATAEVIVETVSDVLAADGDITYAPETNRVYVTSYTRGAIYEWDPAFPGNYKRVAFQEPLDVRAIAWDEQTGRLLVLDGDRLVSADTSSGEITVLADNNGKGTGPDINSGWLVTDSLNHVAYVLDSGFGRAARLLKIVLETGDREEVELSTEIFNTVTAVAFDQAEQRLFAARSSERDIAVIDIGDGTVEFIGPEPALGNWIKGLDYDAIEGSLVITSNAGNLARIDRIDLDTGERTLLSGIGRGDGPGFVRLGDILFSADNGQLHVIDTDMNTLYRVDASTGNRNAVVPELGAGVSIIEPVDLALNDDAKALSVVDEHSLHLLDVPLDGGERRNSGPTDKFPKRLFRLVRAIDSPVLYAIDYTSALYVIDGPDASAQPLLDVPDEWASNAGFVVHHGSRQAFFIQQGLEEDRIGRLNLDTGVGEIISGGGIGEGPLMQSADALTWHPVKEKLIVWNDNSAVLVDPATGNRELLEADGGMHASYVQYDALRDRLLLSQYDRIAEFSLKKGTLASIVDRNDGKGMSGVSYPGGFAYDPERDVLYIASPAFGAILMVDPDSGDEVILGR